MAPFVLAPLIFLALLCKGDNLCSDLSGQYHSAKWHLCWVINYQDQTINLTLSYPNAGYIGLGFGSQMVSSNAIIGWASTYTFIGDYYLGGKSSSAVTIQNNTKLLSSAVFYDGHTTTITFIRNLTVANSNVPPINPNGSNNFIWSWGNAPSSGVQIQQHSDRDYGSINLATGDVSTSVDKGKQAHAALMGLGWGLFLMTGIVIARFGKHDPRWFFFHRGFQTFGLILVIIAWCIGVFKIGSGTEKTHFVLGTLALVLAVFQPLNAAFRPHAPEAGETPSKSRFYWNLLHHGVGRLAILFAIINVFIGFNIFKPKRGAIWAFSIGLVAWTVLILYLQWRAYTAAKGETGISLRSDQKTLMGTARRSSDAD